MKLQLRIALPIGLAELENSLTMNYNPRGSQSKAPLIQMRNSSIDEQKGTCEPQRFEKHQSQLTRY